MFRAVLTWPSLFPWIIARVQLAPCRTLAKTNSPTERKLSSNGWTNLDSPQPLVAAIRPAGEPGCPFLAFTTLHRDEFSREVYGVDDLLAIAQQAPSVSDAAMVLLMTSGASHTGCSCSSSAATAAAAAVARGAERCGTCRTPPGGQALHGALAVARAAGSAVPHPRNIDRGPSR